jgi:hypothetical protein
MKHNGYIFFFSIFLLTLVTWSVCVAAPPQWKEVVPQKLFAEKLRIAAFHNEKFGLNGGAGDIGKARFTTDGGKSWVQADSSGS